MKKSNNKQIVINSKKFFKIQKDKKNTSMPNYHSHDNFEIYYLCSGERYYFIKDKTYHVQQGNVVVIDKNVLHRTNACGTKGYERILVSFSESFIYGVIKALNGGVFDDTLFGLVTNGFSIIKPNVASQQFIEDVLNKMEKEFEGDKKHRNKMLVTTLANLLLYLSRINVSEVVNDDNVSSTHKIVSEIVAFINANYYDDIKLSFIANKFFISEYYLSRVFKKVTGMSFTEYVNNVRIREAKQMLASGKKTVTEVGFSVGFKSSTHFGRVFKEITGVSPLKFKKKI